MARIALSTCVLLLTLIFPLLAAVDGVEVRLKAGEVKGKVRGQGRADVEATVTNKTERFIDGLRIGVYYSATDQLPAGDAKWRVHEFVFEPPLAPGGSTTLSFSDENALDYIKIEAQRARYTFSISYKGLVAATKDPVTERDGVVYAGTRDLLDLIGGRISYDPKSYTLTLTREGRTVQVRAGQKTALVDGKQKQLKHPVLELNGRSIVPLEDLAALFGLKASRDETERMIVIE